MHVCTDCRDLIDGLVPITDCGCLVKLTAIGPKNGYAYWRNTTAHRWYYQHAHGVVLPSYIDVRHSCDVRLCLRLDHLMSGTRLDNMTDAKLRNRTRYGERSHFAVITADTARAIYQAAQTLPQDDVAAMFNVNQSSVSRIATGRTWFRETADLR